MESNERCLFCKFVFNKITTENYYCVKNPPVLVLGVEYGQYPKVGSAGWCGAFEKPLENPKDPIK